LLASIFRFSVNLPGNRCTDMICSDHRGGATCVHQRVTERLSERKMLERTSPLDRFRWKRLSTELHKMVSWGNVGVAPQTCLCMWTIRILPCLITITLTDSSPPCARESFTAQSTATTVTLVGRPLRSMTCGRFHIPMSANPESHTLNPSHRRSLQSCCPKVASLKWSWS